MNSPSAERRSVVWKYAVHPGAFALALPAGSEVLAVGHQHDGSVLWARIPFPPGSQMQTRSFRVVPTGDPFPDDGWCVFIGTWSIPDPLGTLWFHLFECQEERPAR